VELREQLIEAEVDRMPEDYQFRFWNMIARGESMSMALMFVSRQAPIMGESERSFCETRHRCMGNMDPHNRKKILEIAKQSGINTHGKYYMGGLGRYNDPQAWVSSVEDAKAVCKRKNLTAKGLFNVKGHEVEPRKKIKLAPDLQARFIQQELKNPKTAEKVKKNPKRGLAALKEKVIAEHGGRD